MTGFDARTDALHRQRALLSENNTKFTKTVISTKKNVIFTQLSMLTRSYKVYTVGPSLTRLLHIRLQCQLLCRNELQWQKYNTRSIVD